MVSGFACGAGPAAGTGSLETGLGSSHHAGGDAVGLLLKGVVGGTDFELCLQRKRRQRGAAGRLCCGEETEQ